MFVCGKYRHQRQYLKVIDGIQAVGIGILRLQMRSRHPAPKEGRVADWGIGREEKNCLSALKILKSFIPKIFTMWIKQE